MLRSRRVWIGIAISAFFFALFLFQNRNFGEIRDAFGDVNPWLAFASLPVYFLGIWVRTLRWQYLLRPVTRVSVWRLYPVVIIGLTANNLLPARAGELVRAYALGERERVSKAAALGTIAVDRLFDGLTLIPLMLLIAAFAGGQEQFDIDLAVMRLNVGFEELAIIMSALFGVALVFLLALALSQGLRDGCDALILRLTPQRLRPKVEGLAAAFFNGLKSLRSPVDLVVAWALSGVSWVLEATMYYMIGVAFGIDVGFHVFLLLTAASNLLIAVIASQGGIGPFEFATQQTLVAFGVGSASASAYAVGLHALVLLPVIAIGIYLLGTMGFSLGELLGRSTTDASPDAVPAFSREEAAGS